jgi:hypothetical protein
MQEEMMAAEAKGQKLATTTDPALDDTETDSDYEEEDSV